MTIGIDIDDTITKTAEYLMPYMAEYFSMDLDYLNNNNYNYIIFPEEIKGREAEFGKEVYEKVLLDVELKDNVREIINKLKSEGNRIVIITARTNKFYSDAYLFTSKQLEKLGIKYDKLICSHDKRSACIEEKVNLFIDDSVDNVTSVSEVVDNVLLFNSKLNKTMDCKFKRVNTWEDIYNFYLENK